MSIRSLQVKHRTVYDTGTSYCCRLVTEQGCEEIVTVAVSYTFDPYQGRKATRVYEGLGFIPKEVPVGSQRWLEIVSALDEIK